MMIAGQAIAGDSPGRPLLERIWEHAAAAPGHLAYQEIHRDGSEGRALSYADLAARIRSHAGEPAAS